MTQTRQDLVNKCDPVSTQLDDEVNIMIVIKTISLKVIIDSNNVLTQ
jgi:hypothetical protein